MSGSPAGRVLALLERVQERPGRTAPELAADLGVSERTVRRYVATLQELGIPVHTERGRRAGFRLRPGYRMPPLMLTTDEAVALTLAMAVVNGGGAGDGDAGDAGQVALAKLRHALPRDVAERMATVLEAVTPPASGWFTAGAPHPGRLAALTVGAVRRQVCRIRHRAADGTATERDLNPYGVVAVRGAAYVHGWCHLRNARRTFRVDRIERVDLLDRTFRAPRDLDVAAAVEESLALARPEWKVSLLLDGPLPEVERWIPRFLGVCEVVDDATTRVRSSTSNPDWFVLRILDQPFEITVEDPVELRAAFERAARRMSAAAARRP